MKWINAEQKVTVIVYDEEHDEHHDKIMTVEEMLDTYTNEGCPGMYSIPEQKQERWKRQLLTALIEARRWRKTNEDRGRDRRGELMDKNELDKLQEYIEKNDWFYMRKDENWSGVIYGNKCEHDVHQLIVYKANGDRLFDAICQKGSFGYDQGLLEVMGEIVKDDYDVEGWLTAAEIIKRLEEKKTQ